MQLHPAFHLVMVPWAARVPRRRPSGSVRSRTSCNCSRVQGGPGISPRESQRRTTGGDTLQAAAAWRTEEIEPFSICLRRLTTRTLVDDHRSPRCEAVPHL